MNIFRGKVNKKIIATVAVFGILFLIFINLTNAPVSKSNILYGYVDKTGQMVIKPQFDKAGDFHEGLAYACNRKCGYIDKTGKFVIKPRFVYANDFSEGLAGVTLIKPYSGYIDKKGRFIIKPKFIYVNNFKEGLARVGIWDTFNKKQYTGNVKESSDDKLNPFEVLAKRNRIKDAYINKKGEIVMLFPFGSKGDFNEGLTYIEVNGKYGFIDKTGKVVIEPMFDDLYRGFYEGVAVVKQ